MIQDITIVDNYSYNYNYPSPRYILSGPLHCRFQLCMAARYSYIWLLF